MDNRNNLPQETSQETTEKKPNILALIVWALIFTGLGLWMIFDPNMMEGQVASGRRAGMKQLLINIWGIPVGIISLLLGGFNIFSLVNAFRNNES